MSRSATPRASPPPVLRSILHSGLIARYLVLICLRLGTPHPKRVHCWVSIANTNKDLDRKSLVQSDIFRILCGQSLEGVSP
jgi:hypothetical protein